MVSVLAILCFRNESRHLRACIEDLLNDDIPVHLIDHASTDDSLDIAREYLGHGVEAIDSMPWEGAFSLSEQMRTKSRIADTVTQDWLVHIDADERLESATPDQSLLEAIVEVDRSGSNCVNFEEMVFLPPPGTSVDRADYRSNMADYYFFEPSQTRLMRMFKPAEVQGWGHAGHYVQSKNLRLHPVNFVLRHYIAQGDVAMADKYMNRRFAAEDLAKGWHQNRLNISSYALPDFEAYPYMKALPAADSRVFDRSNPATTHFWQWR